MKKFVALFSIILIVCLLETGFALEEEILSTDPSFTLDSIAMLPGDQVILGGDTKDGAIIYCYDLNQKTMREIASQMDDATAGRTFYDMSWDEDTSMLVSLLYGGREDTQEQESSLLMISDDGLTPVVTDREQAFAVCARDHQIIYAYVSKGADGYGAGISCVTESREKVWEIEIGKWIHYDKIIPYGTGVLCMGNYYLNHDSSPQGVLTAIDASGKILWSHTTEDYVEYVDCAILNDDSVVVVGNTENPDEPEYGYLACFDQSGLKWKEIKDFGSEFLLSRAVCAVDDRILCIYSRRPKGIKLNEFRLATYGSDGAFLTEEKITLEHMQLVRKFTFSLRNDSIYLFITGNTSTENRWDNQMSAFVIIE